MYGVWNTVAKEWQFGIQQPTKNKARKELFRKIGYDAYKWRFEVKHIEGWNGWLKHLERKKDQHENAYTSSLRRKSGSH